MTNWQTATANLFTRLTIKQIMKRTDSIEMLRARVGAVERLFPAKPSGCEIRSDPLPDCDSEWVVPRSIRTDRVVLHFPGGAYVARFPSLERGLVARLCAAAHARGRIVYYRLAPEHPFPAGHDDCLAAYRQLLDHGIAADRIVVSGISAGGGMALGIALAIRDRGWPMPAGVIAMSPFTDLTDPRDGSRARNATRDPVIAHASGVQLRDLYAPGDAKLPPNPYVSPVFGHFEHVPPVLFQVGSTETLLDDSRRCAERIHAAGGSAEVEIWEGMPHGWQGFAFIPESQQAIERIADFIRMQVP
jgi:monoterpene epsilon-lactone hydrolase